MDSFIIITCSKNFLANSFESCLEHVFKFLQWIRTICGKSEDFSLSDRIVPILDMLCLDELLLNTAANCNKVCTPITMTGKVNVMIDNALTLDNKTSIYLNKLVITFNAAFPQKIYKTSSTKNLILMTRWGNSENGYFSLMASINWT